MNTIVCNTATGAVSEYTGFGFQSITATHAGAANGLFLLGGDSDAGQPIVAKVHMPRTLREGTQKNLMHLVWVAIKGSGCAELTVYGERQSWSYPFHLRASGESRCEVGRGIRENYVGIGLRTPAGQAFSLDWVEVQTAKSQRRI